MIPSWWSRGLASRARTARRGACRFRPNLEVLEQRDMPAVFTVVLGGDANPSGNGVPAGTSGTAGDLRFCINQAELSPGNEIDFNLPAGQQTIVLQGPLPALFNQVFLNGTSQPGYAGTPLIVLDGSLAGPFNSGLSIVGGNSEIDGLEITHFSGNGVWLQSSNNQILNNVITGNQGDGVLIGQSEVPASFNLVQGNVISSNGSDGVAVVGFSFQGAFQPNGDAILTNSISGNAGLGINLIGNPGPEPIDPIQPDPSGPNFLQNYPTLTSGTLTATATTIAGNLQSTPGHTYLIQFFANPTADPSGFGQGQIFVGSITVTTDATTGTATFSAAFAPLAFGPAWVVSATATDITTGSTSVTGITGVTATTGITSTTGVTGTTGSPSSPANNTSEFSPDLALKIIPPPPPTPTPPAPPSLNSAAPTLVQALVPAPVHLPPLGSPPLPASGSPNEILLPSFVILAAVPNQADYILFPNGFLGNVSVHQFFSEFESVRGGNTITITGLAFQDSNGTGVREAGEPGLQGVVFYLAHDPDDPYDGTKPTAVTDRNGEFRFTGLVPGQYVVQPVPNRRYRITEPEEGIYQILLSAEENTSVVFGFRPVRPRNRPRPTPTPLVPTSDIPVGPTGLGAAELEMLPVPHEPSDGEHRLRDSWFRDFAAERAGLDLSRETEESSAVAEPWLAQLVMAGVVFGARQARRKRESDAERCAR